MYLDKQEKKNDKNNTPTKTNVVNTILSLSNNGCKKKTRARFSIIIIARKVITSRPVLNPKNISKINKSFGNLRVYE